MPDYLENPLLTPSVDAHDHSEGDANAPVTLVEYGDFECPDCGVAYPIIKELQKRLGAQLRFVYRHYPLEQHPHAIHAAEAAEGASVQGKFWQMHATLFEHQHALNDHQLQQYAQSVGLDMERFTRDIVQHTYVNRIEKDAESGDESGVEGTPTFFINGAIYDASYDLETLQAALEDAASKH